jgi:coenzyme F420-reducing hydrogenase delta subunit
LGSKKDGEVRTIAFLDTKIGYPAADNMGASKLSYPESIRIINIPSVLRLSPHHINVAFKLGADGVFIGQGFEAESCGEDFESVEAKLNKLSEDVLKLGVDPARLKIYRVYIPHFVGLHKRLISFDQAIRINDAHKRQLTEVEIGSE